ASLRSSRAAPRGAVASRPRSPTGSRSRTMFELDENAADPLGAGVYVHPAALVETSSIGEQTRIWAFSHVLDGAVIGRDCNVADHCFIEGGVVIGDGVTIKNGNHLWDGLTLGDGVFVGPGVCFTNDRNPRSPRLDAARDRYAGRGWLTPTTIQRGASLGAGCV